MPIRYKLTDENMQTHGGCQWKLNKPKITDGTGDLCGPGWLHVYTSPELAILLNPLHANFSNPRLFECRVSGKSKKDCGLKEGWTRVTLEKELRLPVPTINQHIYFAIQCELICKPSEDFSAWAANWITGKDRSSAAAHAAANAAAHAAAHADKKINLIAIAKEAFDWQDPVVGCMNA